MTQYIDKDALVAEIERKLKFVGKRLERNNSYSKEGNISWERDKALYDNYNKILSFIDTLEVIDPYEQCIQYANIEAGIKAHAEDYSFNIESELFNQLTKEQQTFWRKEIEQACISGGYNGLDLAKDQRYKETLEVKDMNMMIHTIIAECCDWLAMNTNLSHNEIEGCRNLMLTVKEEQLKAQK